MTTTAGLPALQAAFDRGDAAECRRLLRDHPRLVDATASDGLRFLMSALHRESHGAAEGLSETFRQAGAQVDVFAAAAAGDLEVVERCWEADPDSLIRSDVWGMQPLHWAAHCGHVRLAEYLIEQGAPVNHPAASWTPLHLAAELGHGDMVRLLLSRGADPAARLDAEHDRMTPQEMAKAWGLPDMAAILEAWDGP